MKIIFDSEDELEAYVLEACPPKDYVDICPDKDMSCKECWQRSGIQIEIKSDKEESVEMTNETKVTYADCVYEVIKDECEGMDAIYEDYIVSLVGNCGLAALKRAGLVEGCGSINFRPLYVLCDKK